MSNAWKELQEKNRRLDQDRFEAEEEDRLFFRVYLPGLLATSLLYFSDEFRSDPIGQIEVLTSIRDLAGQGAAAFATTISYWALIGLTMFGLYREERPFRLLVASWVLWAWFAYSTYFVGDLKLAFSVGFVVALFCVKIVGVLEGSYLIIRERMFIGSGK